MVRQGKSLGSARGGWVRGLLEADPKWTVAFGSGGGGWGTLRPEADGEGLGREIPRLHPLAGDYQIWMGNQGAHLGPIDWAVELGHRLLTGGWVLRV